MKRREKRREKKRNVNELKSQPSAKQSNTRRLLGAVHSLATYWKFRQVAPVQQFAAYRMHHPRHPFVTSLQPPRHDRSWSKIYFGREKRKKQNEYFKKKKNKKKKKENDLEEVPCTRPSDSYTQSAHLSRVRIAHVQSTQHVTSSHVEDE